jgi:hypothetical protein
MTLRPTLTPPLPLLSISTPSVKLEGVFCGGRGLGYESPELKERGD